MSNVTKKRAPVGGPRLHWEQTLDFGRGTLDERNGAPGMIRTCDPLIRSQVLYPAELRVPFLVNSKW